MTETIDWGVEVQDERNEAPSVTMKLGDIPLGQGIDITIDSVKMTRTGFLVADVQSEELDGNTLWLTGKFGMQNGAYSLMQLVNGSVNSEDIVGEYHVTKVPSDKTRTGYRYEWTN